MPNNVNNYVAPQPRQQQPRASFFNLRNDGENATVKLMYSSVNDVVYYNVHEVMLNNKKRNVECLRSDYNQPYDTCPFCAAGNRAKTKMYIPLYNKATSQVELWDRGRDFIPRMQNICNSIPDLGNHAFKITRHGAPYQRGVVYDIQDLGNDGVSVSQLPQVPKVEGGLVMKKSADEMNEYLRTGNFPRPNAGAAFSPQAQFNPIPRRVNVEQPSAQQSYINNTSNGENVF